MNVLKGILSESREYYIDARDRIHKKLAILPRGSIKVREISGRRYYYLQHRIGEKVVHKYLGKDKPEELLNGLKKRKILKAELIKVNEALKILKRSEGRKRG